MRNSEIRFFAIVATLTSLLTLALASPVHAASGPRLDRAPTLRMSYGFVDPSLKEVQAPFADLGTVEIGIGSMTLEVARDNLVECEVGEVQVGRVSAPLREGAAFGETELEGWRANLNWATGYGYPIGKVRFVLTQTMGLGFTRVDIDTSGFGDGDDPAVAADLRDLGYFDEEIRFGTNMEAGALLQIGSFAGIQAGYERSLAFRSFQGFEWLGSALLEQAGRALLTAFVDRVRERRPAAVPILNFVLQNGWSYAAYELRRKDMYFPFDSAPPLLLDNFKVGVRFTF